MQKLNPTHHYVVPGLLLSFAARLDAAKALVGMISGDRMLSTTSTTTSSSSSSTSAPAGTPFCFWTRHYYFVPLVIAYAIGLLMANIAVYVMNMGQPALLYLVPCTLGTMTLLGYRRQELTSLWTGPKVIDVANDIVYNNGQRTIHRGRNRQGRNRDGSGNNIGNENDDGTSNEQNDDNDDDNVDEHQQEYHDHDNGKLL